LAGPQGSQGETGTANVIYSDWIMVEQADWEGDPSSFLDTDISAPEITQDIIDMGLVFVYRKLGNNNVILKLNFMDFNGWNNLFMMNIGTLNIIVHKGTASSDVQKRDLQYRYVVVPGGVAAGGRLGISSQQVIYNELAEAGVDVNDYAQVAAYYNIQD